MAPPIKLITPSHRLEAITPIMSQSLLLLTLEDHKVRQTATRATYILPIFILKELGITRWSRQRPPAPERVEEISKWIHEHQDVVGTISLAWHPTERLVCYDGQHRLQALLEQENMEITVLVEIMWNATELAIVEAFRTINRAVPVSELYTDPQDVLHSVKGEIADYVTGLATTYKPFLSTSAKPCRPNFNRDALGEALYHLWRDELHEVVPFQRIITGLTRLNETYDTNEMSLPRLKTVKKYPGIHKKCSQHSFWLMAETGHLPVGDLKRLL